MGIRRVLGAVAWAAFLAIVVYWAISQLHALPGDPGSYLPWAALGPVLSLLESAAHIARRGVRSKEVQQAFAAPGAPELRENAVIPRVELVPEGIPGHLVAMANAAQDLLRSTRGIRTEVIRAETSDQSIYQDAKRRAASTKGLGYLKGNVVDAIVLHIVIDRLRLIDAPGALRLAENDLASLRTNYGALFSHASLMGADLSETKPHETYFTKYFQPLMLEFAANRFVRSSGQGSDDPRHALMGHLQHLSDKRVIAGRLTAATPRIIAEAKLRRGLPQAASKGIGNKRERGQVSRRNSNDAARAVLVVADAEAQNHAQSFDATYHPLRTFEDARLEIDYWSTTNHAVTGCYLWQRPARKQKTEAQLDLVP